MYKQHCGLAAADNYEDFSGLASLASKPCTGEAKLGGWQVQGQPGLHGRQWKTRQRPFQNPVCGSEFLVFQMQAGDGYGCQQAKRSGQCSVVLNQA